MMLSFLLCCCCSQEKLMFRLTELCFRHLYGTLNLVSDRKSPVNNDSNITGINAVNMTGKQRDFGGADHGDDQAALVNLGNKALTQIVQEDSFQEFEFRQYLFACQSKVCPARSTCIT